MKHVGLIKSKLEVLLVFLVIFVSGGFINLDVQVTVFVSAIISILLLLLIIMRGSIKRPAVNRAMIVITFAMLILFIKLLFANDGFEYTPFFFRLIGNLLIAILILMYFHSNRQRLFECFYVVLVFILAQSWISLLLWLIVQSSLTPSGVENINTFGYLVYYHSMINLNTIQLFGLTIPRNYGLFWEPGILQLYLNILLYIVLYVKKNLKITLLTLIAILFTWSTTGLVVLSLQLIIFSLVNIKNYIYSMLSVVLLISLSGLIIKNVDEKLTGENAGSGYSRALDTFTVINIIKKYPALGIDLNFEDFEEKLFNNTANIQMEGRYESRQARATNALLTYYVFFGLFFGSLIVYGLYKQKLFHEKPGIVFLILALSLSTEPIGLFIFPILLIVSGIMYDKNYVANT